MWPPPVIRSRIKMIVVRIVTISSTNMTGFLISVSGLSLTKDEQIAGTTIFASNSAEVGVCLRSVELSIAVTPSLIRCKQGAGIDRELFDDRAERQRREEGEPADDHDDANHQPDEQAAGGRERTGGGRDRLLGR